MMVKAFGLSASGGNGFSDTTGLWASEGIAALQDNGVIMGYADGSFHPKQEITRAEMVTMLARLTNYVTSTSPQFSDISKNWAVDSINAFASAGKVSGKVGVQTGRICFSRRISSDDYPSPGYAPCNLRIIYCLQSVDMCG